MPTPMTIEMENEMTKDEIQAAIDRMEMSVEEFRDKDIVLDAARAYLQSAQVKAETVDLDAMRDHFEKWMTANGDYPHLIHKHFGGNYLREETSMKWDGFKQGVKYAQR
jgi:acyl carrier protein phosphodiesterase